MTMKTAQDLLKHDLGDLLYAEKQILKGIKPMIRQTTDAEMKDRLEQHRQETEQQIDNLEQAFQAMGLKPKAQKCPGILGIIEEKKEFEKDEEPTPEVLESFNLGAGLRVEHYEIAAYRSALALAKSLAQREVAELLKANLDQEVAMARFIESASARVLRTTQASIREDEIQQASGSTGRSTGGRAGGGVSGARKAASKSTGKSAGGAARKSSRAGTRVGTQTGTRADTQAGASA